MYHGYFALATACATVLATDRMTCSLTSAGKIQMPHIAQNPSSTPVLLAELVSV